MHLNVSQQMKMGQHMKLAPRMIQSMEILQLPLAALEERIDEELAENVCLERSNNSTEQTQSDEHADTREVDAPTKDVEEREMVAEDNNASDFERLLEISSEWPEDNYTSGSRVSADRIDSDGDRQHDAMANALERPQTLHEYLLDQFGYFDIEPVEEAFGEYLIQNLDENGRLQSSLPEIVQMSGTGISLEQAEDVVDLIQKLDPPGVGARDLRECLLLQITNRTPMHEELRAIIGDHLDDLSHNRLPAIQKKTGLPMDVVKDAIIEMRSLNPFPGAGFERSTVRNVTPDLRVSRNDEGDWKVEIIDEYMPSLRLSGRYLKLLKQNPDAATKEFIKKKVESAKWLISSIEQRYDTLRKVAQAIVNRQSEFLEKGPDFIIPLKMQQIADEVGVHVTTVSRAVDDKHIIAPRGIFPLKRFFGGGTTTSDGEEVAWENIRRKLKEIVDGEDKSKPLSDEALVESLKEHGFELARRTVTKYRKAMNIPSSRQRREY